MFDPEKWTKERKDDFILVYDQLEEKTSVQTGDQGGQQGGQGASGQALRPDAVCVCTAADAEAFLVLYDAPQDLIAKVLGATVVLGVRLCRVRCPVCASPHVLHVLSAAFSSTTYGRANAPAHAMIESVRQHNLSGVWMDTAMCSFGLRSS